MARPPIDPELEPALAAYAEMTPAALTPDTIATMRESSADLVPTDELIDDAGIEIRDVTTTSYDGVEIELSVLQPKGRTGSGPGFFHIHGGGMILGHRRIGVDVTFPWLHSHNGVCVSVEYRLAPESPDPAPVEDCYAGLSWTAEHADELGIHPDRLFVVGASAGGGLAAGAALLARDRRGPELCGQLLMYPMLDDRDATVSTRQHDEVGTWIRDNNRDAWTALLGERRGTDDVSIYAAPARATDLSGLPPTFIDCGSAEVFRDEDVAYASRIWAAGGRAELHVWPGGFHAFEVAAPEARLSRQMIAARDSWVARLLGS